MKKSSLAFRQLVTKVDSIDKLKWRIQSTTITAMLLLAVVFLSCNEVSDYKENRLSGVFPLRQLVQKKEINSSSSGNFFLFFASYHSSQNNIDYIKMFAKVSGNYRLISVPIEQIRVNINDSLTIPTLQVKYNGLLKTDEEVCSDLYNRVFIISCPEKYLPEKLLPISL